MKAEEMPFEIAVSVVDPSGIEASRRAYLEKMVKLLDYPEGVVLAFSEGCYSDYRTTGFYKTLKPCNLPALAKQFISDDLARIREPWEFKDYNIGRFALWLMANKYIEAIDYQEVHLGDYGEFNDEFTQ
jgi:hypothetical protein